MDQIAEHIIRLPVCCCAASTASLPLPGPRLNTVHAFSKKKNDTVDGVEFRGGPGDGKKDGVSLDLRGSRQGCELEYSTWDPARSRLRIKSCGFWPVQHAGDAFPSRADQQPCVVAVSIIV